VFKPEKVIECGCGPNSTPIWSKFCKSVIGIEHNKEWIDYLKDIVGTNVKFIFKDFHDIIFSTYCDKLSKGMKYDIYNWYNDTGYSADVLYVDSFAGTRVYALMALAKNCGVTIYHDTEVSKYWYNRFEEKFTEYYADGYRNFSYRPRVHNVIFETEEEMPDGYRTIPRQEPTTDIIFRPDHYDRIEEFKILLHEEHEKYYWKDSPYEFVEV